MSRRHRLSYVAIGRCLGVVVLTLGSATAVGQQQAQVAEEPLTQDVPSAENGQADQQEEQQGEETETQQEPTVETAPVAPVIGPGPVRGEPEEGQAQSEENADTPKSVWHDTGAQWTMAVAGILAVIISGIAVEFLRRTLRATRDAVSVAGNANQIMLDTAQLQLRAYVTTRPFFFVAFSENTRAGAKFNITNTGHTPAHELRQVAKIDVFPRKLPDDFAFPDISVAPSLIGVLFPQQEFQGEVRATRPFSKEEITAIRDETKRLYIWGVVYYRDIFGTERRTRFAAAVKADTATLEKLTSGYEPDDLKLTFETTKQHIDAT